jgi:hypothetical protein
MKNLSFQILSVGLLLGGSLSAIAESDINEAKNTLVVKIGPKTFTVTLAENATATAFKAMLPLKLPMEDVNANEKVSSLPGKLPTNDANPRFIQTGDLMIWTSRSVVLFYKGFPTTYSYTRLGRIETQRGSQLPSAREM